MEENNIENKLNATPAPLANNTYKRRKIMIIVSVLVVLIVLVTIYFLKKDKVAPQKIYTDTEKLEMIEEVARRTEEQGLPPVEKQIDIMKYNAQN